MNLPEKDTYKEVRTMYFPNGTAHVYIPDLTEEERSRRMRIIHDAAAAVLRCVERNREHTQISK